MAPTSPIPPSEHRSSGPVPDVGVLARIRSYWPDLSRKERAIAAFLLESPVEGSLLSQQQIADQCGVSPSSVSRFAARFGFPSFRSFQVALGSSVAQTDGLTDDLLFSDEPPLQVIGKMFEITRRGLSDTESLVDKAALIDTAQRIAEARNVFLIGQGGSAIIAKDGETRLGQVDIRAQALLDPFQVVTTVGYMTPEDVLVAVSHSGRTRAIVSNVRHAVARGVHTVAISNYASSPLAHASATVLLTAYREGAIHAARTSSHIAQLCLMDCLYFLVAQIKAGSVREAIDEIERQMRDEIR